MQNIIENFLNDFYAELDTYGDSKAFAEQFFTDESTLSHLKEVFRGLDGITEWYDSVKAGFSQSVHTVKGFEYAEFDDVYAVECDVVWTAAFRNLETKNMIRYKLKVRMDLAEYCGKLKIKHYISNAVG